MPSRTPRLRLLRTLVIGLTAGALLTVATVLMEDSADPMPTLRVSAGRAVTVRYEVESTEPAARATIRYRTSTEGWRRTEHAELPWVTALEVYPPLVLSVTAEGPSDVSSSVFVDGALITRDAPLGRPATAQVWLSD